ncbi:MAG: response regulator [Acidobacteria bacterium]|nr:response regulator [Acidobacteriota bacterium]
MTTGSHSVAQGPEPVKPRVLLVDDESLITSLIQRSLRRSWDITCASSAMAALDLIRTQPFDAIVCDLMMPVMTGMEFAEKLAGLNPLLRARTLFLTGGAATPEAEAFLARSDVRHMTKPLRMADLDARLLALLAQGPAASRP